MVVEGAVDVVGADVVEVLELWTGEIPDAEDPGCSLATTTPITTAAPVAATAANRVRKRSDASARRRVSGEGTCRGGFIEYSLVGLDRCNQPRIHPALRPAVDEL